MFDNHFPSSSQEMSNSEVTVSSSRQVIPDSQQLQLNQETTVLNPSCLCVTAARLRHWAKPPTVLKTVTTAVGQLCVINVYLGVFTNLS